MDYEKKYLEALEKARQFSEHPLEEDSSSIVEYIFPELKESEDERIRKWLINTIKSVPNDSIEWDVIDKSDILAWLEKQGEKTINQPDFEIPFGAKDSELIEESYYIPKGYHAEISKDKVTIKKGEQKPVWSKEDEERLKSCLNSLQAKGIMGVTEAINTKWLKSIRQRIG